MRALHAGRLWRRGCFVSAAALAAAGVLAGSARGAGAPARPAPTSWLSAIPDTAAYRSVIVVSDLRTLWTAAGLSFPPPVRYLTTNAGEAISSQIGGLSALGPAWFSYNNVPSDDLGYDVWSTATEVSAGLQSSQLSLVQGAIDATDVRAALAKHGVQVASGGVDRYTLSKQYKLNAPAPTFALLRYTRHIDVPAGGGVAAAGGIRVPPGQVLNLVRGRHAPRSLASDRDVRQMLALLAGSDTMAFGTSTTIGWNNLQRPTAEVLRDNPGLTRLPAAPRFAGYGYLPGNPGHATARVVAIYPGAHDATVAAAITRAILASGRDAESGVRFRRLFAYRITVHGDAVEARLTDHTHGRLTVMLADRPSDFPLFLAPPPQG